MQSFVLCRAHEQNSLKRLQTGPATAVTSESTSYYCWCCIVLFFYYEYLSVCKQLCMHLTTLLSVRTFRLLRYSCFSVVFCIFQMHVPLSSSVCGSHVIVSCRNS